MEVPITPMPPMSGLRVLGAQRSTMQGFRESEPTKSISRAHRNGVDQIAFVIS